MKQRVNPNTCSVAVRRVLCDFGRIKIIQQLIRISTLVLRLLERQLAIWCYDLVMYRKKVKAIKNLKEEKKIHFLSLISRQKSRYFTSRK